MAVTWLHCIFNRLFDVFKSANSMCFCVLGHVPKNFKIKVFPGIIICLSYIYIKFLLSFAFGIRILLPIQIMS